MFYGNAFNYFKLYERLIIVDIQLASNRIAYTFILLSIHSKVHFFSTKVHCYIVVVVLVLINISCFFSSVPTILALPCLLSNFPSHLLFSFRVLMFSRLWKIAVETGKLHGSSHYTEIGWRFSSGWLLFLLLIYWWSDP